MSWAEVYKINSDMTTPLNENYTVVTGDKVFKTLIHPSNDVEVDSSNPYIETLIPKISGTCILNAEIRRGQTAGDAYLKIYEDDTMIISKSIGMTQVGENYTDITFELPLNKGKEIKIEITSTQNLILYIENLRLKGETVGGKIFEDVVEV